MSGYHISNSLRNGVNRGTKLKKAVIFVIIIFTLCSVINYVSYVGYSLYQSKQIKQIPENPTTNRKDHIVDEHICHESHNFSQPIDLVFTWVNGSDKTFIDAMKRFQPRGKSISPARHRDWGTLLYALRSVEKYADWFNHVYIVTNGQVPNWLKLGYQKVSMVNLPEIFQNLSHLPTFNSLAVECHIHRIPGLSQHFIYMNDDFFFAKKVDLADFYTRETGFKIRFGPTFVPDCTDKCRLSHINNGICDTSCNTSFCEWDGEDCQTVATKNNQSSILYHFGAYKGSLFYTAIKFNKAFGYLHRRVPAHVPYIIDKDTMNALQIRFPQEWARTSAHRFRDAHSIQYAFAYYHFLLRPRQNRWGCERTDQIATTYQDYKDYIYLDTGNATSLENELTFLLHHKHVKFVCINDLLHYQNEDEEAGTRKVLSKFFEEYFPQPSSFEVI